MPQGDTTIDIHSHDDSDETIDSKTTPEHPRSFTKTKIFDKESVQGSGPWLSGGPYKYPIPQKGDPWGKCYKKVEKYDDDMCDGWRGEVDNLIVFAGLFSAAVTTFVIESYQQLQEDPNDRNGFILEQILIQVQNTNNPILPPRPPLSPPVFTPSTTSIRVNVFWFMSLSLSLATVFVGILCMQWLREYQRESPLDPQDAISLRQLRYEGLMAWKVPDILMSLPVLLHASLILFFAGLIDLLWSIHKTVAIAVSVVSGTVLLFLLTTTLLPSWQLFFISELRKPQCPYKSPQSWAVHRLITKIVKLSDPVNTPFRTPFRVTRYKPFFEDKDWVDYDKHWQEARNKPHASQANTDIVNGLAWIDKHLGQTVDMAYAMYHCIKDMPPAASVHVVSLINERIKDHLSSGPMSKYIQTTNEEERREIYATLFLEANKLSFPQFDQFQLESVVRILNTRLESKKDDQHTENDHIPIQDSLPFIRWPLQYVRGLPEDLITQFLSCIKILIAQGHMKADYEEEIWTLVQLILSGRDAYASHKSHVKLAFEIIAAFEDRLQPNNEDTKNPMLKDVIKACVLHVIKVWPPGERRDLAPYADPVLSALLTRMEGAGGVRSVLLAEDQVRWEAIAERIGG